MALRFFADHCVASTVFPPQRYGGIVAQVRNHPKTTGAILSRLLDYLDAHPERAHYRGRLLIVEPHRIRVRG